MDLLNSHIVDIIVFCLYWHVYIMLLKHNNGINRKIWRDCFLKCSGFLNKFDRYALWIRTRQRQKSNTVLLMLVEVGVLSHQKSHHQTQMSLCSIWTRQVAWCLSSIHWITKPVIATRYVSQLLTAFIAPMTFLSLTLLTLMIITQDFQNLSTRYE